MKRFEGFGLDLENGCLWRDTSEVLLTPKLFAVLRYFVDRPQKLISQDELLDAVWPETFVQPQVLRTYILELRKILGDDAANPRYIQTIPKRGYRFLPAVSESVESARPAHSSSIAPGVVGRKAELEELERQLHGAANGERRLVFVTGETGIGKSTLLDAFCQKACSTAQVRVLRGQCVEGFGGKESYYPVMEILEQIARGADGEASMRVMARLAPTWYARLASSRSDLPEARALSGEAPVDRVLGEICDALETLAQERPLILALDDLQWADGCTLDAVSALARRRSPARLMIVATFRHNETRSDACHALKELKQNLSIRRLCVELNLTQLSRGAVQEYLATHFGQASVPSGLASFVHQHSEGNPLFMTAMIEHMITQKLLVKEGTAWRLRKPLAEIDPGVPEELAQMIELEIDRLDPEEQRMLEGGSLLGVIFPAWAGAAALDADLVEAEERYDKLAHHLHFLRPAGHDELPDGTRSAFYVFAHSMYREALYRRQSSSKRSRRHLRIAKKLETMFAGREAQIALELAGHYEEAGDWSSAVAALEMAANRAWERSAFDEAHSLVRRGLALLENLPDSQRERAKSALLERTQALDFEAQAVTCAADGAPNTHRKL